VKGDTISVVIQAAVVTTCMALNTDLPSGVAEIEQQLQQFVHEDDLV